MLSDNQRRWKDRFDRAKDEVLEHDRQREADRLASEANPPKDDGSRCDVPMNGIIFLFDVHCPLGTYGCRLKHDGSDPILGN